MTNPAKYPKTKHLPNSPNKSVQEIETLENFINKDIVILEKMDGANCLFNTNGVYSRSCQGFAHGKDWDYIKGYHAKIKDQLYDSLSYFGENLTTKHTIQYKDLPDLLMLFGIRDNTNNWWFSWDSILFAAKKLNLPTVPYLWDGKVSSEKELFELTDHYGNESSNYGEREGIVVRTYSMFSDEEFDTHVAKWVRKGHVKGQHWSKNISVPNSRRTSKQPCRICGSTDDLTLIKREGFFCKEHLIQIVKD